jgi:hypothetical protein
MVSVVFDSTSTFYVGWRDKVLALRRYSLDNHILCNTSIKAQDLAWLRLNNIAMSWIFGTISLDLQDVIWTHSGTTHQAWLALEGQFLGSVEARALQLDQS